MIISAEWGHFPLCYITAKLGKKKFRTLGRYETLYIFVELKREKGEREHLLSFHSSRVETLFTFNQFEDF